MTSLCERDYLIALTGLILLVCALVSGCLQKDLTYGNSPENNPENNESPRGLSVFHHIEKNISYEDMKRWEENYTPPTPIPESEMAHVIFSRTLFIWNDEDPQPDIVQLTFPRKWLDKPEVSGDEPVILLRVPKRLLELNNINPDPEKITLNFRADRFREFSNVTTINQTR